MLQIYYRKTSKGKIKSPQARAAEQAGCLALEHALAIFSARLVGNAVSVLARPDIAVPQAASWGTGRHLE